MSKFRPTRTINIRIDDERLSNFDYTCAGRGIDRSTGIRLAMDQFMAEAPAPPPPTPTETSISIDADARKAILLLTRRVKRLEAQLAEEGREPGDEWQSTLNELEEQ